MTTQRIWILEFDANKIFTADAEPIDDGSGSFRVTSGKAVLPLHPRLFAVTQEGAIGRLKAHFEAAKPAAEAKLAWINSTTPEDAIANATFVDAEHPAIPEHMMEPKPPIQIQVGANGQIIPASTETKVAADGETTREKDTISAEDVGTVPADLVT